MFKVNSPGERTLIIYNRKNNTINIWDCDYKVFSELMIKSLQVMTNARLRLEVHSDCAKKKTQEASYIR